MLAGPCLVPGSHIHTSLPALLFHILTSGSVGQVHRLPLSLLSFPSLYKDNVSFPSLYKDNVVYNVNF